MSSLTCYSDKTKEKSWVKCYSASNNYDFNFPAKMADGRIWSQWNPDAVVNERIQKKEGIQSNWQYRQFLQKNSLPIMNYNSQEACYNIGLDPHYNTDKTPSSNVPYTFKGTFDTGRPGFGYCNSDLKNPYLSREQLNARLVSPSIDVSKFSK